MSTSIEPIDPTGDSGVTVVVGDTRLSLRQFQDLYAEIGRRSDRILKRSKTPFVLEYDDLKNLHQRIAHFLSHLQVLSQKLHISINHTGDDVQEFDSFEKFMTYDRAKSSPISSILYELTFALPSTLQLEKKVREYTIGIFLSSNVADLKEIQEDSNVDDAMTGFGISDYSAVMNIKYFDYAVAVSCMSLLVDWLKSLPVTSDTKSHIFLHKYRMVASFVLHGLLITPVLVLLGLSWDLTFTYSDNLLIIFYVYSPDLLLCCIECFIIFLCDSKLELLQLKPILSFYLTQEIGG